jgi:transposase
LTQDETRSRSEDCLTLPLPRLLPGFGAALPAATLSLNLEAALALVLAAVLALPIVETPVSRRKPSVTPAASADPAAVALLQTLHPHAAGIDVGAAEMMVCVPPGCVGAAAADAPLPANVRCFGTFTPDLHQLADWLRQCHVDTIAMEATGVYWIPLFDLLETQGFKVILVDPGQTRRAPNRPKTDVLDCQWIQRLHSLGLLSAAFRPEEVIRTWRSYQRHRANLVEDAARHIQRMQKALELMNVKLTEVVSDITGLTGMSIIQAIVAGEREAHTLAQLRDCRCKESVATIRQALAGTWQAEHLFALKQSLELYQYYHQQIRACDQAIEAHLKTMALPQSKPLPPKPKARRRRRDNEATFDARQRLFDLAGVDLTLIEGIESSTAQTVLSEIGLDMSRWPSEKEFGSWLGLAPNPKKSGGKLKSSATRPGVNRAAQALRLAARNLRQSKSALGAFFRRVAARRGVPKAITATAYKLARIIYAMLKHGTEYAAQGMQAYETAYKERQLRQLKRLAADLNMELVAKEAAGSTKA